MNRLAQPEPRGTDQTSLQLHRPARAVRQGAFVSSMAAAALALALHASPVGAQSVATGAASESAARAGQEATIHPFRVAVPEADLADLRRRVLATRWADKETVSDKSQGVQQAKVQELVKYWGMHYDWRKIEAKLNALPQFVTTIDGVDIQFIHVRSTQANALPLILTHGWPGSPLEFLKTIGPLTDPTAYGGHAEDAFDVIIPAIPGHGFSGKPTELGWGPARVARAWDVLVKRLGYTRYVSQGGDHGSVISNALTLQRPAGLLGIHLNMPATVPAKFTKGINSGETAPAGLPESERAAFNSLSKFFARNAAYGAMMVTRPQTIGYGLSDSPAGLAAWMYEKFAEWTDSGGEPERVLTRDEMLDDITLYWLTNSASSTSRFYWENNNNNFSAAAQKTREISIPVAVTVFPGEIYRAPKSWTQQAFRRLIYFNEVDKGGHFAAWEQPQLFAEEMRSAFRSLR
jgi:pimeloyl-ACP methyl ester carboxylesterase